MSNINYFPISKFNGNDYDYWSINMMIFSIRKYLWEIVERGYKEPIDWTTFVANDRTTEKEENNKNYLALFHT